MTHPTLHRPVQRYLAISIHRRFLMQWTTPQALDFRFGFEITMYVAAR
jgi:coenzyme PQQ precursor peptide PqqA